MSSRTKSNYVHNKSQIPSSSRYLVAICTTTPILVGLLLITNSCTIPVALAQHMMMPPAASVGNRKIVSHFEVTPKIIRVGQNALMKIFFVDQNTKQKIYHVTVRMDISNAGKHILSEFFHSHDGDINVNIRQTSGSVTSPPTHTVGGTIDDLTNAWIADPGSPVIVNGQIFSHPGTYKMILEVTTLDNDKTDLAQPLKYEYNIPVSQ
ncbi:MAG: hypothetical protein WBP64_08650 [Nitrososphaeraceae archaeon]